MTEKCNQKVSCYKLNLQLRFASAIGLCHAVIFLQNYDVSVVSYADSALVIVQTQARAG